MTRTVNSRVADNALITQLTTLSNCFKESLGGTQKRYIKIIDLKRVTITAKALKSLMSDLRMGKIGIVSSPTLSNHSVEDNRCASVVDIYKDGDYIVAMLTPCGPKQRIFKQMMRDNFEIIAKVAGSGDFVTQVDDRSLLMINKVKYITLDFTK